MIAEREKSGNDPGRSGFPGRKTDPFRGPRSVLRNALLLVLFMVSQARALAPEEIVVIANSRVPEGVALARLYMRGRAIPADHLILLNSTTGETCSRNAYDRQIRNPVLAFLRHLDPRPRIRCLVTMYGVPLKIAPLDPGRPDTATTRAAVDSELALVLAGDYPLSGWQPNPYFLGFQHRSLKTGKNQVLMVARLDGPDPSTVRRLIHDALTVEKRKNTRGSACLDARWPKPGRKDGERDGYRRYDLSLHRTALLLRKQDRMPVRLDQRSRLFGPGECPDPFFYCGWYGPGQYRDIFAWQQGAVGYHIASFACSGLRNPRDGSWCAGMLENGVAATLGPVAEPFVQAFPLPEIFFPRLSEGYLTLAEAWLISLPYLSWQMVLIGDPLYTPFSPLPDEEKPLEKQRENTYTIHMHEKRRDRGPLAPASEATRRQLRPPSPPGIPVPQGGRP